MSQRNSESFGMQIGTFTAWSQRTFGHYSSRLQDERSPNSHVRPIGSSGHSSLRLQQGGQSLRVVCSVQCPVPHCICPLSLDFVCVFARKLVTRDRSVVDWRKSQLKEKEEGSVSTL